MGNINVYRCYSTKERDFLRDSGVQYIIKCRDIKTYAEMFLYERTDELTILLDNCKTLV